MKNNHVRSTGRVAAVVLLWIGLTLTACIRPESSTTPGANTPDATAEAPAAATLADSQWQLVTFGAPDAETPVLAGSTITLAFSADGEAGGASGCNTYGGSYEVQADQLVFGEMVSTLMACADQAMMEQEMAYLTALQSAGRFAVDGDMLRIWYDDEQGVLIFTAA